jgi:hypothetical protein
MPQERELFTIGDMGAFAPRPLQRSNARRRSVSMPMRGTAALYGMGATIVGWSPPAAASMTTVGSALQDAAVALQNYLDTSGVPAESTSDPNVSAFQTAWNADAVAGVARLDVDGGYGPNTYSALNALTGQASPPAGTAPAPVAPGVIPGGGGQVVPSSGASSFPWGWALLGAGGLALLWMLMKRRKKKSGGHHTGSIVEVKTNPRRRKAARRGKTKKKSRR